MKKLIKYFLNFLGYKIIKKNSIDEYSIDLNEDENQLIKIRNMHGMLTHLTNSDQKKLIKFFRDAVIDLNDGTSNSENGSSDNGTSQTNSSS